MYSVEQITQHMNTVKPESKFSHGADYTQIATDWLDLNVLECLRGLDNQITGAKLVDFRVMNVRDHFAYKYNGKRWFDELNSWFPFYTMMVRGRNISGHSEISKVKLIHNRLELFAHFYNKDFSDTLLKVNPISAENCELTPIDAKNLQRYIDNTVHTVDNSTKYDKNKLLNYLYKAKSILDISNAHNGVLPQNYSVKPTGRTYMSGVNLQNCKTTVRNAAIGKCYKYDLRTSVFSHMLQLLIDHYGEQFNVKASYINELVQHKKRVRKTIARDALTHTKTDIDVKISLVKEALTALSFGATEKGKSIGDIIYHKADREAFFEHEFVKELKKEIDLYKDIMKISYPQGKKQYGEYLRKNGRTSLNKWCSFAYQAIESMIINHIKANAIRGDVLLCVHDALYTRNRQDLHLLNHEASQLSTTCQFEEEVVDRVHGISYNISDVNAHKQHIAREEQKARGEINKYA